MLDRMRNAAPWAAPIVLLIVATMLPALLTAYDLNLVARFLAMGILSLGLVLIWGQGGILSLGQGVFFGLGGYALAMHMKLSALGAGEIPDFMMWSGVETLPGWWAPFASPVFATFAIVAIPGALAALFAWSVFHRRVSGTYFALITQALALAFATLLVSQQAYTGGFNGLTDFSTLFGHDLNDPGAGAGLYWVTLAVLAFCYALVTALLRSRFGTVLRAIRDGENRMRFLGYNATPYKVAAFTLAAMLAGIAGALFTLHAGVVSPALVGVVPSIEFVILVAIGGRSSLIGAVAGTLLVGIARDTVSSAFPDLWLYLLGALFILVVTILPNGVAGLFSRRGRTA